MSTIPKTRHIPKFLLAITAGNQVATTLPSSNLSDSQPLCTSGPRRVVSFDELKDVACGAGFTVSSAAALAGVCSSPHIQQAFWAAIEEECQRSRLTLSECLSQFKALSNHPIVCSKEKANNYDQYKLSTHSFNEYRTGAVEGGEGSQTNKRLLTHPTLSQNKISRGFLKWMTTRTPVGVPAPRMRHCPVHTTMRQTTKTKQ
jgi:hypothetical protein